MARSGAGLPRCRARRAPGNGPVAPIRSRHHTAQMKVYEHNDPDSLIPRSHPWIDGESEPAVCLSRRGALSSRAPSQIVGAGGSHTDDSVNCGRPLISTIVLRETRFGISALWQKRPEGWRIIYAHESTVNK